MTIQRTQTGDVEVKVTVYRDGKKLQNSDGNLILVTISVVLEFMRV